jgi:Tfp pilus assembly protein PilV
MHTHHISHTRTPARAAPPAFTTIEVMFALAIITIALGALHGLSARTIRQVTDHHRESVAHSLTHQRTEQIVAASCTNSAGRDSLDAVTLDWSARTNAGVTTVSHSIQYPIASGTHRDSIAESVGCH